MITSSYNDVWIGAKMGTFDFEWEDGNEFNYTNWYSTEPNYNGDCVAMYHSYSFQWIDSECTNGGYYICKQNF